MEPPRASHAPSGRFTPTFWTWCSVVVAGILIVVEKPWALAHAQLWAEDGSVHLVDNEAFGAGAFFLPYRGYLHLLPRMIAWLASRTTDVAYWPTFYNTAAYVVVLVIFIRLASARLDLPGKPWLILAFALSVSTGEVFLNITNLHWLTAFLILAQVLIAAPKTWTQGVADFVILPIVGLTGPFIAVFLPLFVWRWWRERTAYSLAVLAVAALCAGTQAFLVVTTGPHFFVQSEHINFALLFAVMGSRFAVWPLLGPTVALALPLWALSGIGALILLPVVALSLRKDAHRLLRIQILIAFALIAFVGVYRIRPDSWMQANIELGDSYFFIPRILAMWLLIWLFDARPAGVAWIARILCLGGVLLNLGDLIQPTPVDFGWASLCQPIRSGTPANIPTLPEDWILQYPGRATHVEPTTGWYPLESGSRGRPI